MAGWLRDKLMGPRRLSRPGQPLRVPTDLVDLRAYQVDVVPVSDPKGKWLQKVMYVKRHQDYLAGLYGVQGDGRFRAVLVPIPEAGGGSEVRVFLEGLAIGRIPPEDNRHVLDLVRSAGVRGEVVSCYAWIVTGSDGVFGVRLDLPRD